MKTRIVPATIFAGIALAAIPAAAKPATTTSCNNKFSACIDRCLKNYGMEDKYTPSTKASACIKRTCDKQLSNCLDSRPSKNSQTKDPLDPRTGGNRTPPTGGNKGSSKSPGKVNGTRGPAGGGARTKAQGSSGGSFR